MVEGTGHMPGCVLHIVGTAFDPEPVLARLSLQPYSVFRKGEKQFPDNPRSERLHEGGGFKCDVSDAKGDLSEQVKGAIAFLTRHYDDLASLVSIPEIEKKYVDFGYDCRLDCERCWVQCDYLPPELLKLCGGLGIGIELSLYPPLKEPTDNIKVHP